MLGLCYGLFIVVVVYMLVLSLPSSLPTGGTLLVVGGGVTQAAVSVECHVGEERAGEEGEALKRAEFNKTIGKVKFFHFDIPYVMHSLKGPS